MTREDIISDADIVRVHGRANFGTMTAREVVDDGIGKVAVGYHCGHTQFSILREHGLITKPKGMSYDCNLTKKGKKYYRAVLDRRTPAPEGEAWRTVPVEPTEAMIEAAHALWGEGTGVNYVQLEPEDFYAAMLAASPVVPVGVSDQQQAKIKLVLIAYRNRITTLDTATDAILAALRPTDTGRE